VLSVIARAEGQAVSLLLARATDLIRAPAGRAGRGSAELATRAASREADLTANLQAFMFRLTTRMFPPPPTQAPQADSGRSAPARASRR
jgi:hypothetical protein